eukprot:1882732-Pyramimonas_sp.AAC.1
MVDGGRGGTMALPTEMWEAKLELDVIPLASSPWGGEQLQRALETFGRGGGGGTGEETRV